MTIALTGATGFVGQAVLGAPVPALVFVCACQCGATVLPWI